MSATHTSALPDYAPVPQSALHPAPTEHRQYVGRLEQNIYWITDGTYRSAFLTNSVGVVLLDAPRPGALRPSDANNPHPSNDTTDSTTFPPNARWSRC